MPGASASYPPVFVNSAEQPVDGLDHAAAAIRSSCIPGRTVRSPSRGSARSMARFASDGSRGRCPSCRPRRCGVRTRAHRRRRSIGRPWSSMGQAPARTKRPNPVPSPRCRWPTPSVEGQPHERAHCTCAATRRSRASEVPRRWLAVLGGASRSRPNAGSGRRQLGELDRRAAARRPRDGQPHLAAALRQRAGADAERLRHARRGADASRTARLAGGRVRRERLEREGDAPAHHALRGVSAQQRAVPTTLSADPDNRLLARFDRRRLSAEELRDSLLAASGQLDRTPGEGHPFPPEATLELHAAQSVRRRLRDEQAQRLPDGAAAAAAPVPGLFDGADPNASTPARQTTTVPTQALYFLNDPFFHEQAARLAAPLTDSSGRRRSRLAQACSRRCCNASPIDSGATSGRSRFVDKLSRRPPERGTVCAVLLASNEFLHVD